jgi:Multicopper oxidase
MALASDTDNEFELTIDAVDAEMIDGTIVYQLRYFLNDDEPSPVLRVQEGDTITIAITNNDVRPHGFAIPGIPAANVPSIDPGTTTTVQFVAPVGGSYLYLDPVNAPLNRVLGLHGALIVKPLLGTTPNGSPTPYSRATQTPQVQSLFDALGGGIPRFPGKKWNPDDRERQKVWIFSQTDPSLNARVAAGEDVAGASVVRTFLPRYFHINNLSGFDTAEHSGQSSDARKAAGEIMPKGKQGEPCLLRTMNAGLATHAPHIHGNHVMECAENGPNGEVACETHVYERDVWPLRPLDRRDMLLPFERPPDIPLAKWPPKQEPFPLRYVMHCHNEISQTAGGGNYPQGLVTHWEMTAPIYNYGY